MDEHYNRLVCELGGVDVRTEVEKLAKRKDLDKLSDLYVKIRKRGRFMCSPEEFREKYEYIMFCGQVLQKELAENYLSKYLKWEEVEEMMSNVKEKERK